MKSGFGVKRASAQLTDNTEQLEAVLVADANRDRHGHDAAQYRCPECNDEPLVGAGENDQFITRAHATCLEFAEQACRSIPEVAERNGRFVPLAIDKSNFTLFVARIQEDVRHAVVALHLAGFAQAWAKNNAVFGA